MKYIVIETNLGEVNYSKAQKVFVKLLSYIIPKSNPDFEEKIDLVRNWYLEFEEEESEPTREIGLDADGKVIAKMPYEDNYGYWTDNNLNYFDFIERFKYSIIDKDQFEIEWNKI